MAGPRLVTMRRHDADQPHDAQHCCHARQGQGNPGRWRPLRVPRQPGREVSIPRLQGGSAHQDRDGDRGELQGRREGEEAQQGLRGGMPPIPSEPADGISAGAAHLLHLVSSRRRQREVSDVVQHERGEDQPGCRGQRRLGEAAPRVGLEFPRHARAAAAGRGPPPVEHRRAVTGNLYRGRMLEHHRGGGAGHTMNAQFGELRRAVPERRIGQGSCARGTGRAGQIRLRESPGTAEPE